MNTDPIVFRSHTHRFLSFSELLKINQYSLIKCFHEHSVLLIANTRLLINYWSYRREKIHQKTSMNRWIEMDSSSADKLINSKMKRKSKMSESFIQKCFSVLLSEWKKMHLLSLWWWGKNIKLKIKKKVKQKLTRSSVEILFRNHCALARCWEALQCSSVAPLLPSYSKSSR